MFLVQMSLDTKRAEIRKLEEQVSFNPEFFVRRQAICYIHVHHLQAVQCLYIDLQAVPFVHMDL